MQCLDVRRQLTIEPGRDDDALRQHLQQCARCRAFAQQQLQFDGQLMHALRLPVPEGLAARIMLNQSTVAVKRWSSAWHYRGLGLAASLFVVVALVFFVTTRQVPMSPLGKAVLAHVYDELPHLGEHNAVSSSQLDHLLQQYGVKLQGGLGKVNYAGACPINHHVGVHLVLESAGKPVTVLLMPGETVLSRRLLGDARFRGVIVPLGQGGAAIVAEDKSSVRDVELRLEKAALSLS